MTTLEKIRSEIIELFKASGVSNSNLCYAVLQLIYKYAEQEPTKQREKELAEEWKCGYEMGFEEAKVFYEQEPCDDAISRNDMLDAVGHGTTYTSLEVQKIINGLPSVNPVPCDDVVSRQAVLDYIDKMPSELTADGRRMIRRRTLEEYISDTLSSVKPQEQTGHWIEDKTTYAGTGMGNYKCSVCDRINGSWIKDMPSVYPNFCWWCGARMESEEI